MLFFDLSYFEKLPRTHCNGVVFTCNTLTESFRCHVTKYGVTFTMMLICVKNNCYFI